MAKPKYSTQNFEKTYDALNPEQKEAVDTIEGPVLVLAGPGTGKTQVLTTRIANILLKTDTPSSAILALTFTESGVKAMRERLLTIIGPEAYYVNICTFHSFCSDILKTNADKFILAEDLEPLSDLERIALFREIIDENNFSIIKPFGSKYYYVKSLIKTIQDLKREGITPQLFNEAIKHEEDTLKLDEILVCYETYQKKLVEKNRYDFEDMINLVTSKLSTDEELLRDLQEKYLYILVDEYQDTNSPQNMVVNLLANYWGEDANVFVVGDDFQSIYRFQGASLQNILSFKERFTKAKVISLNKNYRSQETVIKAMEDVISNNEVKLSDFIEGVNKIQQSEVELEKAPVEVGHFSSGITESFFIATKIKELIKNGTAPSEIAIIYRNNNDSRDFSDMLSRMDITFNLVGGKNVLEDYDINKLLKLFNVILKVRNKEEDLDLFTVLNYEFLNFDYVDTLKLSRFATIKKLNFIEAIEHVDFEKTSEVKSPQKIKDFLNKVYKWQELDSNETFVSFFENVLEESGFLNWVLKSPDAIEKLNKLNSLFSEIKKLNIADHALNLEKFLIDVEILRESNIAINEESLHIKSNSVMLTTAHRSKGLEFEYVFIVKCYDGKWGNNKTRELIKLPELLTIENSIAQKKKEKNEDERRLFYVAGTRAKKELYITYADSYFSDSFSKEAIPSMFISEITDERKTQIDVSKYENSVKEILKDILKPIIKENVSIEEKDFLKNVLANFSLSVTSLNTYLECAYKFKLNTLLKTPKSKNKYLALGTAVHSALERFFRSLKLANKVPPKEFLLSQFSVALKEEILTKNDFEDIKSKGERILSGYYDFYKASFKKPLFTEKFFGYGGNKIYMDDISINGKVDRIDFINEQEKTVRVIDYKTGGVKSRNEIEGKNKNSDGNYKRQLVFYKILAELDRNFSLTVVEAELNFVEPDKSGKFVKEVFEISQEEISELKQIIKEVMNGIRNLNFERTKDYKVCAMCEYKPHCYPNGLPTSSRA